MDDVILGTQLRGTALTQTHVTPRLIPNDQAIQIALNLQTLAHTKTTGTNSAATAHSLGTTRIIGCKTIYFTASQAHTTPARTMADVTSEIVSFHWGRLFGARIARQRADEQKPLTEQISAQRAEDRASAQFDRQVTQQLDRLARSFRQSMNARIASMPIQPTHLRLRSTTDAVIGDAWFDHGIVTAWPPGLNVRGSQQGVAVQVHQSLLVQTLESLNRSLAGQALDEQQLSQFGNVLSDASGGRSASPRPQRRSRREWTLKMAETRPIQIRITGQGIHVSLNMDSITIDEVPNPPMRVQAVYLPVIRNQACYLERQGRLSLTPVTERQQADGNDSALQKGERTGTAAPPTQRRGARQQVFQSLLRKRFEQVMVPSLSLGPQYRSIDGNSITLTNIDLSDEWITIQAIPR